MKLVYCIPVLLLLLIINGCTTEKLSVIKTDKIPASYFLIGHIEGRYIDYGPYLVDNFKDVLSFEIQRSNMKIVTIPKEYFEPKEQKKQTTKSNTDDELDSLLPSYTTEFYKYSNNTKKRFEIIEHFDKKAIVEMRDKIDFDYLIQGTITQAEVGNFLDKKKNSMIFLEVFDSKGNQIGNINYYVEGKSLAQAGYLNKVCVEIVNELNLTILERNPAQED